MSISTFATKADDRITFTVSSTDVKGDSDLMRLIQERVRQAIRQSLKERVV